MRKLPAQLRLCFNLNGTDSSLIAQAAAPTIGAALLEAYGTDGSLAVLASISAANFGFGIAMFVSLRRSGILIQGAAAR